MAVFETQQSNNLVISIAVLFRQYASLCQYNCTPNDAFLTILVQNVDIWNVIAEGIKNCTRVKEAVEAEDEEEDEIGPAGEVENEEDILDISITDKIEIDPQCLRRKARGIRYLAKKILGEIFPRPKRFPSWHRGN